MALSPAVKQRREKGKRWTNDITGYLLVTTPILILLVPLITDKGTIDTPFLLNPLMLLNPISIMATSLFVLPIPYLISAAVIMSLVILPYIGCRMLNEKKYFGKKLFVWAKSVTIGINVFLAVFMFFSMNWVSVSFTYFLLYPAISVGIPALELYFLNLWVPEEAIPQKLPSMDR